VIELTKQSIKTKHEKQRTTSSIASLPTIKTMNAHQDEDEPQVIPKSRTGRFLEFFFRKEEEAGDKLISWVWLRELPSHLPFAGLPPVQHSPKVNHQERKHQDKGSHFEEYH
jgi:hypothetical protein